MNEQAKGDADLHEPYVSCARPACPEPAWPRSSDGYCLGHAPNNGRDDKTTREVWELALARAKEGRGDFSCWHFPQASGDYQYGFGGMTFQHYVNFIDAVFEGSAFENAKFVRPVHFNRARFRRRCEFTNARFEGGAVFSRAVFEDVVNFTGVRFGGIASFWHATFEGDAYFPPTVFEDDADFCNATFDGHLVLLKASFHGAVQFVGASIAEGKYVILQGHVDHPLTSDTLFSRPEEGEELYRLAKNAATAAGNYAAGGQFHHAEQCAIEYGNRKRWGWKPWRWRFWSGCFELLFGRWVFGYGEKPVRVLLVALLVILAWAGAYWGRDAVVPHQPTPHEAMLYAGGAPFKECLHFSVVTFTTLGYGDLVPKPGYRWLADLEAVLGAGLMALFIVGLARKYTR